MNELFCKDLKPKRGAFRILSSITYEPVKSQSLETKNRLLDRYYHQLTQMPLNRYQYVSSRNWISLEQIRKKLKNEKIDSIFFIS